MKKILCGREELFGPWMMHILDGHWFPGRGSIIGLWDQKLCIPLAACLFEGCNGASIMLHIAANGKRWMNREYLWFVFYYPFIQLGINKIISPVEGGNAACRTFIEHIGFTLEATLKDAAPQGDLLIYTMTKDQCKWLNLKERYRGQTKGPCTT